MMTINRYVGGVPSIATDDLNKPLFENVSPFSFVNVQRILISSNVIDGFIVFSSAKLISTGSN